MLTSLSKGLDAPWLREVYQATSLLCFRSKRCCVSMSMALRRRVLSIAALAAVWRSTLSLGGASLVPTAIDRAGPVLRGRDSDRAETGWEISSLVGLAGIGAEDAVRSRGGEGHRLAAVAALAMVEMEMVGDGRRGAVAGGAGDFGRAASGARVSGARCAGVGDGRRGVGPGLTGAGAVATSG